MAIQTPILYNTANAAFIAGATAGSQPGSTAPATLIASAAAFAAAVDASLGVQAPLATAATTTITAATAADFNSVGSLPLALFGICFGVAFQRYSTDAAQGDWAALAAQVKTLYLAAIAGNSLT